MNELQVRIANNYGNNVIYPVCDKAKVFAEIAGSKTLTEAICRKIKSLGYRFVVVQDYRCDAIAV